MSKVPPVTKTFIVAQSLAEVMSTLLNRLRELGGRIAHSDESSIRCDFGSLLKSRLLGEFFVDKSVLPKRVEIQAERKGPRQTEVRLLVVDTHKYGFKLGYTAKFIDALEELAESIALAFSKVAETDKAAPSDKVVRVEQPSSDIRTEPAEAPFHETVPRTRRSSVDAEKKVAAGICGIFFGWLGLHKFLLGYRTEGLIMLCVSLLTCGLGVCIMGPIGLIEGIIYLTKPDEEFVATYIKGRKGWF